MTDSVIVDRQPDNVIVDTKEVKAEAARLGMSVWAFRLSSNILAEAAATGVYRHHERMPRQRRLEQLSSGIKRLQAAEPVDGLISVGTSQISCAVRDQIVAAMQEEYTDWIDGRL